ncbi:unknown [Clostridium sp. CAG:448]|nr:unknown [Clostridium sp. CAG:448]
MRIFKVALAIFLLLIAVIIMNALYIRHVGEQLSTKLEGLSDQPCIDTLGDIREIRTYWEKAQKIVNISVGYCETDRFDELLLSIEEYCMLGNADEYHRTVALAQNAAKDLVRLEKLSLINIF